MIDYSLKNKKALVCGSTQGIGLAIAENMADLGAEVTLFARNELKMMQVCEGLNTQNGQNHSYLVADFSNPDQVSEVVNTFAEKQDEFHILVNNTGGPSPGLLWKAPASDLLSAMQLHLVNNHNIVQALLPAMKNADYGRIVNVISTSVKAPIPGLGVSNTTRGAVASWSKSLSAELAPFGITVNNVLPGFTRTARLEQLFAKRSSEMGISQVEYEKEMIKSIPARRIGDPKEVAAVACFLASPAASYINGESIRADGGRTPSI